MTCNTHRNTSVDRCKLNILARFFFFSGIFFVLSISSEATEFENWTFLGAEGKIGKMRLSLHNANFFRNGSDYFLNHTQIMLDFPSKRTFYFAVGYKQEYVDFTTRWRKEYRPFADLFYKKKLGNWEFKDRNRWEFRFMDGDLVNRYRNQIQFSYKKYKITPYVSTEFFVGIDKSGYSRQRTMVGTNIPVKKLNFNLFLANQLSETDSGTWSGKIMMGTSAIYSF